ncbi:Type I Iterative Polyketide synthase (PKS) [Steccherinum ochraceum]|uniref:Type I Iterative Polyketide synthase (PKS) n=1 Tax=Steccherinum ochraceum TaxID=92696 RepID=A0A4R0RD21_9APHY|nr:Type I Iterative Polyketide synthase (PKS) [Steccherinum ochraceum]
MENGPCRSALTEWVLLLLIISASTLNSSTYAMSSAIIPQTYDLIVLDGQGTAAASTPQTVTLALQDATSPLGNAVLVACYQAFLQDYATLSNDEKLITGLDLSVVDQPSTFLAYSITARPNAVSANVSLYLTQLLRYIAHLHPTSFTIDVDGVQHHALLGFSTGMFAASVIAAAHSVPSLVTYSVEAFRLAFWLGLRAQQYAQMSLADSAISNTSPWSLVVFGASQQELKESVDRFNLDHPGLPNVYVTAVTTATCVSVSGRPNALDAYQKLSLPPSASLSRHALIHTLYHSSDLIDIRTQVLADVARQNISFPTHAALRRPLCSTVSGQWLSSQSSSDVSLVDEIVDMTLLHPVNFDLVSEAIARDLAKANVASIKLINVGPGNALSRAFARSLSDIKIESFDWSAGSVSGPSLGPQAPTPTREAVAIVGMAVKFPGANDASGLWEVLEKGLNTVSEIPQSRFNVSDYTSGAGGASKRSMKTRFGNFIDNPDAFDNAFFRISPREARSMDPQQRLLLQVTYHALENAGYVPGATETFDPDTFATYVGVATNDYVQNLRNNADVYYSTGTLPAFLSGKISYAFGFSGPSMVIDTACSSSMVAIYQACRALTNGDCNAAVAGGVNVMTSADMYIGLDRAHFLSSTGQCKPWDASADGYCRSEGCGMFVLKRLSDAVKENDNILGVIRGIEINQSANAESITHPHVPTQMALFDKLVSATGVDPRSISVIEAHGTGTKAGDPTEIESIRGVFARNRTQENPLHLTSIKANIGHAEAASGAASLAKLVLMMKHHAIPGVISLKQLNPRIPDLAVDGTRIDTEFTQWNTPGEAQKRVALLNNFGAAGSNAALILEEADAASHPSPLDTATCNAFVFGISAESEEALEILRSAFIERIDCGADAALPALADLAYSATARRQLHTYRLAVSGQTKDEITQRLKIAQAVHVHETRGKTVFVFSGQGGQYVGMGARLYHTIPAFRQVVDECDSKLVSWGFSGVIGVIAPVDGSDHQETDIQAFQSAVFVLEYALWTLWTSWGITPDAVAGHSLGEYAALVAANVLSLNDALKLVAGRARLMVQKCAAGQSGMLAVKASPSAISSLLSEKAAYDSLSIACYNSSADCVIAGELTQLDALKTELKGSGTKCVSVNVPFAYHTDAMAPIFDDIITLAKDVTIFAPSIPILSNVRGTMVPAGEASTFNHEYFARHCRDPVRFEQCIQDLLSQSDFAAVTTWMEVGPHPTTLPMLRSMPATSQQAMYLPSLKKNADDWQTLASSLTSIYCARLPVKWRKVFSDLGPGARLTDLPAYPFAQTKYWVAFEEEVAREPRSATPAAPSAPKFSLIDSCVSMPVVGSKDPAIFHTSISTVAHLIEGHKVSGYGLCPASVYVEMASAAARVVLEHHGAILPGSLIKPSNITFSNPLVYAPDVPRTIRVEISLTSSGEPHTGSFEISSYPGEQSTKSQVHCSGVFDHGSIASSTSKLALSSTMIQGRRKSVLNGQDSETFHTRTAYNVIFSRIVAYSELYHTMKTITVDSDGSDAYAVVKLPAEAVPGDYVVNPIFTDTLLHAAGFLINLNASNNEAFICAQVDKINIVPDLVKDDATYGVYCSIGMLSETMAVADAYAINLEQGTVVAHMKRMHFRRLRTAGFKSLLSTAVSHSTTILSASGVVTPASVESGATLLENDPAADLPDTSALMEKLKETMGSVLDLNPKILGEDQELERLGLDSLTSIEAHHALCTSLSVALPDNLFMTSKTIRDLFESISRCTASQALRAEIKATLFPKPVTPLPSTPVCPPATVQIQASSPAASAIKTIMASVLDMPVHDLRDDVDLERLGLDSLMSIEAHHALCAALKVTLPADILLTCKTIRDLQDTISPSTPAPISASSPPTSSAVESYGTELNPVPIQNVDRSNLSPLFLIHDGGGLASQYKKLGALERPVYGIHNPKFPVGGNWDGGIIEMATHYVGLIQRQLLDRRECLLGGWSVGGVLAFEVSRQLARVGISVAGLILIDSPCPQTKATLTDSVIDAVFSSKGKGPSKLRDLAKENIKALTRTLVAYDHTASPAHGLTVPRTIMLACNEGVSVQAIDSCSTRWLADRSDLSRMVFGWEKATGSRIPILEIPGNHFEVFESRNIDQVTQQLRQALSILA